MGILNNLNNAIYSNSKNNCLQVRVDWQTKSIQNFRIKKKKIRKIIRNRKIIKLFKLN